MTNQKESTGIFESPAESQMGREDNTINLFSIWNTTDHLEEMKKNQAEESYVLGKLAQLGQSTTIYAQYNTGKTLITLALLVEAIKEGRVNPKNVTYVNADDDYNGIVTKGEIADKYGFQIIAPGYYGFDKESQFLDTIELMIEDDIARGQVVIVDVFKSFADPMSKIEQKRFNGLMKKFIAHGGTMIILAHTNKHKDGDGNSVHAGTSDLADDSSAVYILDTIEEGEEYKTVEFRKKKLRGANDVKAAYRYKTKPADYSDLLNSVKRVDEDEQRRMVAQKLTRENLETNAEIIDVALGLIKDGFTLKTDLINKIHQSIAEPKSKVKKALDMHDGPTYSYGHRWNSHKGEKHSIVYSITTRENAYAKAKCIQ